MFSDVLLQADELMNTAAQSSELLGEERVQAIGSLQKTLRRTYAERDATLVENLQMVSQMAETLEL